MTPAGEFELIDAIVAELGEASAGPQVLLGPGDDAAMIAVPADNALVTSVDTLLPDVHFPAKAAARLIGERALRVSISDLAAMGAEPLACVVSLVLPRDADTGWVRELTKGMASAARRFACPVTGGNLTAGPLSICVTVQGAVPVELALSRSGAKPGDDVWVSGALGGAAVALAAGGLEEVSSTVSPDSVTADSAGQVSMTGAQKQYFFPQPQLSLGIGLRGLASAAIDISDGLAADLGHVARMSDVSVELRSEAIPRLAGATLTQALYGGDDYHLCFTAPVEQRQAIAALVASSTEACRIGTVATGAGELLLDGEPLTQRGFDHFANRSET